jgi:hypothetical protein
VAGAGPRRAWAGADPAASTAAAARKHARMIVPSVEME